MGAKQLPEPCVVVPGVQILRRKYPGACTAAVRLAPALAPTIPLKTRQP